MESSFYSKGAFPRKINLDPGYIDLAKVILFSTKDFYHRIYISENIFAETTLYYAKKDYKFLPWTFPDYKSENYLSFFRGLRKIYRMHAYKGR